MKYSPGSPYRLAAFDMDETILEGTVIYAVAKEFRIMGELKKILRSTSIPYLRSRKAATLPQRLSITGWLGL